MTYEFKAFECKTVEIIYFSYAHFKEIEIVLSLKSQIDSMHKYNRNILVFKVFKVFQLI